MIFSAEQIEVLRNLTRMWSRTPFVLIGASAMNVRMGRRCRETYDLDFVLAVPLARYPAGLESAPGWSRDPRNEQSWRAPGEVRVDIIPVGDGEADRGALTWPRAGIEMSLTGIRLAFDCAVTIHPAPSLEILVAPLEVLVLLKMVAYLDRPSERERDLADIALLLTDYVGDTNDRRYDDDILDLGLNFQEISPYLLGRDLSKVVNRVEREAVMRFLEVIRRTDDSMAAQARMLRHAPASWRRDPEQLIVRIAAFERGFNLRLP